MLVFRNEVNMLVAPDTAEEAEMREKIRKDVIPSKYCIVYYRPVTSTLVLAK